MIRASIHFRSLIIIYKDFIQHSIQTMANQGLPFKVRATDIIHRSTVLGLVGICVAGLGAISYNLYSNSDYAKMNQSKLKFEPESKDSDKQN